MLFSKRRGVGNVLRKAVILFLAAAVLFSFGCGKSEKKTKNVKLSYKAWRALNYVKSLPEGQKNVLLHGTGSEEDKANAMANLSASGHLQGFAEYLEATSSE